MISNTDRYNRLFSMCIALIIVGLLTAGFGYVWYEYYSKTIVFPYYRRGNWVFIGTYCILLCLFLRVYDGFKFGYLKKKDVLYSQLLSIACTNFVVYCISCLIGRVFMSILPMTILIFADFGFIILLMNVIEKFYSLIYPPRKLIILYGGSAKVAELVLKMTKRVDKYIICESISINENRKKIETLLKKYEGVIICDIPTNLRNYYLKFCFDHSIHMYITPKISDILIRGANNIRLFDTPLLLCSKYGLDVEQRIIKRTFDIIFSVLVLIVSAPLIIFSALVVKFYDGGPVLYKQKRLTLNGKEFYIYKFRSMIVNAEKFSGAQLSSMNDPRITYVGHFLRKLRADEFPQFINIIKGEMSVVGPRPERPELFELYKRETPEFEFRLKVKAGLTGYAQVTGVYDTTPYDKLKMDLMYIENYSFYMDLKIILMTLKTILFNIKNNNNATTKERKEGE